MADDGTQHQRRTLAGEDRLPLCVDLDDTLLRSDMLWEGTAQLLTRPFFLLRALAALCVHGKAAFKELLAGETDVEAAGLPYREEVLDFARSEYAQGRTLVLATATHRILAEEIARHLGIFSRVFATDGTCNLSGDEKRAAMESEFGSGGFDYIGDSDKDIPIFAVARRAYLVNPSKRLLARTTEFGNVAKVIVDPPSTLATTAKALRLHQWAKNVLLAVPMMAAHQVFNLHAWFSVFLAFVGFGLVASATYLINDLIDLRSDRAHPKKRFRPMASGRLSIRSGLLLALACGVAGFGLSLLMLPSAFAGFLIFYLVLTLAYSFDLKRRLLVDVLALAMLYSLRILAGGVAVNIVVSEWLLMFSLFIFLSLAFLKRLIELHGKEGDSRVPGRGYSPTDYETIRSIGVAAGMMSVLVFSLYISSPAVSQLYHSPKWLWLLTPVLIYWIARIWFLAGRGEVHHDPVVFALLDPYSYVIGLAGIIAIACAKYGLPAVHL